MKFGVTWPLDPGRDVVERRCARDLLSTGVEVNHGEVYRPLVPRVDRWWDGIVRRQGVPQTLALTFRFESLPVIEEKGRLYRRRSVIHGKGQTAVVFATRTANGLRRDSKRLVSERKGARK